MHTLAREDDLTVTMTTPESWTDYVRRVTAGLPRKAVAQAAEINVSGVSRWLTGASRPSPEKVISFARGLRLSPIEALVAAGYLDETDVGGAVQIVQSLDTLSDDSLVDELRGRLRERSVGTGRLGDKPKRPLSTHLGRNTNKRRGQQG